MIMDAMNQNAAAIGRLAAMIEAANGDASFAAAAIAAPAKLAPALVAAAQTKEWSHLIHAAAGVSLPEALTASEQADAWRAYMEQKGAPPEERARREVAMAIRAAREQKGVSQQQLAEAAGVGQNHIARIESGRYGSSIDTIAKIAAALCVKVHI